MNFAPGSASSWSAKRVTADPLDVLIVGGGPAGSATALRLARAGHRVRLVDRAAFPRDKACSEYMSPETVRHLDALGVLGAIEAHGGTPLTGTKVTGPRGSTLTGYFDRAGGAPFRATGLATSRRVLDYELLSAAREAGAEVVENCDARRMAGEPRTARVTIGADGLHSTVARHAGLHRHGRIRRVAFVAHVADVPGLDRTAELHVGRAGYAGINPLGNGIANVSLVVPASIARDVRGDVHRFFHDALDQLPGVRGRVRRDRMMRDVISTGPFDVMSRRSTADGVLLVGDAADFFDPFTGEGIGAALKGAELAAQCVDTALRHAQGAVLTRRDLAPYRSARRRAFLGKWIVERLIGYAMLAPGFFDHAIGRIERHGLSHRLIGVTGNFVSPWQVIAPGFLLRTLL